MAPSASKLAAGQTYEEVVVEDLKRTQLVQYAGASGDYNPVHTDEIYATKVAGYPTVFAHGMLTMGLAGKMLTNFVGDGTLTRFGVRFARQVWPGDTLTATATVDSVREEGGQQLAEISIVVINQHGDVVLNGSACARAAG